MPSNPDKQAERSKGKRAAAAHAAGREPGVNGRPRKESRASSRASSSRAAAQHLSAAQTEQFIDPSAAAASSSAPPTEQSCDSFVPADIYAVLSKFSCGDGGPAERDELEGRLESWLTRGGNANAVIPGAELGDDPSANPTILQYMALDAHHYSLRAFELLMQNGADVDAPRISVHCRTPLWNAVQSVVAATRGGWGEACSVGVVSILLRAGARDPEALWDMYRLVCVPTPVADLYDQMVELHD